MQQQNLWKGLLAGVVGGAVATLAKTIWEEHFPVRSASTPTPPAIIAERVTDTISGRELTKSEKETAEQNIHWTFGTTAGAGYGVLAEAVPYAATGMGLPFGTLFYLGTHASVVPALDLEPYPTEVKREYARNEFAGHLVYGLSLEVMRRGVRKLLG